MSKKILSVMLALVLALSCFAVSAFAESVAFEDEDAEITYTQKWTLGEPVEDTDGTYKVDISLATDYVVGVISFRIDALNGATLEAVKVNEEIVDYDYELAFNKNGKVNIIPAPLGDADLGLGAPAAEGDPEGIDGVIATLTYKLADGKDSDTLTLANDAKKVGNPGGDLFAVRLSDHNLSTSTFYAGQLVVDEDGEEITDEAIASVTIGAAVPADLAKTATAEAGILIDTAHTFGGAYKGVVYGFKQSAPNTFMNTTYLTTNLEATNGGSLAFSHSIGKSGYGTGTVITVKNADGTEAAKYVVVIFGDVDGNGLTNTNDTADTKKAGANQTFYADNSVQRMAANCQIVAAARMMHTINTNDTFEVKVNAAGKRIDQAAIATKMASLTDYYK